MSDHADAIRRTVAWFWVPLDRRGEAHAAMPSLRLHNQPKVAARSEAA